MSTTAPTLATTPIPVQLSEPEFTAFILPHLSIPKRGPKCKLGIFAYPPDKVYSSDYSVVVHEAEGIRRYRYTLTLERP